MLQVSYIKVITVNEYDRYFFDHLTLESWWSYLSLDSLSQKFMDSDHLTRTDHVDR